jgi:hypothetical protein
MAKEHLVPGGEVLICFESTSQAIMAEQSLLESKFSVRVMPKPSAIEAGCGFCLRFLPNDIKKALVFLSERGIHVKETYRAEESGGTLSYHKTVIGSNSNFKP